ncbi:MAG: aminoglycoside 3-N-acetyltransferase [Actinobacteria bacterium]|nr:aminoglycoside 3-N-acetyltransferase [Actinomycetota bacterium]
MESQRLPIVHSQLVRDLIRLGLEAGDTVMVHSSMRAVGKVLGGPDVVIRALLDVIGAAGTVMMYVDWEDGVQHLTRDDAAEKLDVRLLEELPPFNPKTSRARRAHGILSEFLRTWPGACRSGNPDASIAAVGVQAQWLCADHPLQYGYGPGSPLAKLVEVRGKVLLLGAPFDTVTLLHYAEHMARLPNKRVIRYREPLLVNGAKVWMEIEEFDTSQPVVAGAWESYFADIVQEYLASGKGRSGQVGYAPSYLLNAADLYQYAVAWMEGHFGT